MAIDDLDGEVGRGIDVEINRLLVAHSVSIRQIEGLVRLDASIVLLPAIRRRSGEVHGGAKAHGDLDDEGMEAVGVPLVRMSWRQENDVSIDVENSRPATLVPNAKHFVIAVPADALQGDDLIGRGLPSGRQCLSRRLRRGRHGRPPFSVLGRGIP
jgi:hypothetical protein